MQKLCSRIGEHVAFAYNSQGGNEDRDVMGAFVSPCEIVRKLQTSFYVLHHKGNKQENSPRCIIELFGLNCFSNNFVLFLLFLNYIHIYLKIFLKLRLCSCSAIADIHFIFVIVYCSLLPQPQTPTSFR